MAIASDTPAGESSPGDSTHGMTRLELADTASIATFVLSHAVTL